MEALAGQHTRMDRLQEERQAQLVEAASHLAQLDAEYQAMLACPLLQAAGLDVERAASDIEHAASAQEFCYCLNGRACLSLLRHRLLAVLHAT